MPKAKDAASPPFTRTHLGAWRKAVKAIRGKELSQGELALAIGIHNGHLSNIEAGKKQYTQEILEKAVTYLRTWFPSLTVADVITINPNDPDSADLVDFARRVPEPKREAARMMLRALAEQNSAGFHIREGPPAPAKKAKRR